MLMKKFILLVVFLLIFTMAFQIFSVFAVPNSENAGEKLKNLGIVKGYEKYGLREEKPITEGEYLALVARVLRAKERVEIEDLIKVNNPFDEFANAVYKFSVRFKKFFIRNFYNTLALNPKYEPVKGVKRDSWFFQDALYLKINGFKFPEDFSHDKIISPQKMLEFLISALRINSYELTKKPEGFSEEELLKITLIQQGLFDEGFIKKPSVTRGEAFNLILYLYENK